MTQDLKAFLEAQDINARKIGFELWLAEPLTKVVLSTVEPTGANEALIELMRSAFNAGFAAGGAQLAYQLMSNAGKPRT